MLEIHQDARAASWTASLRSTRRARFVNAKRVLRQAWCRPGSVRFGRNRNGRRKMRQNRQIPGSAEFHWWAVLVSNQRPRLVRTKRAISHGVEPTATEWHGSEKPPHRRGFHTFTEYDRGLSVDTGKWHRCGTRMAPFHALNGGTRSLRNHRSSGNRKPLGYAATEEAAASGQKDARRWTIFSALLVRYPQIGGSKRRSRIQSLDHYETQPARLMREEIAQALAQLDA
jgi:hypothetical protein